MNTSTSSQRPRRRLDCLPQGHQQALIDAIHKLRQPALGWTQHLLNGLPKQLQIDWNGDITGSCDDYDQARGDGRLRLNHQYDTFFLLPPHIPADLNYRAAVPFWLLKPTPAGRATAAQPLACGVYHPVQDTMTVLPLDPLTNRIGYRIYLWHDSREEDLGDGLCGLIEQHFELEELEQQNAMPTDWPLGSGLPDLGVIAAA